LVVKGHVLFLGLGQNSMDKLHVAHGLVLEILVPSHILAVILALKRLGSIQSEQGSIAAVSVQEALISVMVIVAHISHSILLAVNSQRGLIALNNAGVVNHQENRYHYENDSQGGIQDLCLLFRSLLLRRPGSLGINTAAGDKFLPLFLLSGCAHSCSFLPKFSAVPTKGNRVS